MTVWYKVVSKRPGGIAGDRSPKYYPAITKRGLINTQELAELLAEQSTFHPGVIHGVIECLMRMIPTMLQNGKSVKLDGFGTFSLHVSADGRDDPKVVSHKDITQVKMAFLPDKRIKEKLARTKFEKLR